ncbi:MAG TPA: SLATT domain-containing protein [Thermoleophilaceae bacterium]|jgi:cellulose biosynthesis protein BcsQ
MTRHGEIVTFYSYKGGTGRTMALANTAVVYARRNGGEVLAMDWDLEAPGLHRFFDHPAWSAEERPGTVDLLYELAAHVKRTRGRADVPLDEEQTRALFDEIDLERYVVSVEPGLSVVWAGRSEDDAYAERINGFDWDGLYRRAPFLFTVLARTLSARYARVLVDSRTGISDTSGVCTAVLPEKLVVVFTPNQQSLDGALRRARLAVTYRRQSDDLRPLLVYPLASRVELSEDDLRHRWRHGSEPGREPSVYEMHVRGYQPRFEELLTELYGLPKCDLQAWFDEVQIQHSTRYAYGEDIAVAEEGSMADRLSLARSYAGFARALDESDAPWKIKRQADTRREAGEEREEATLERLNRELDWHDYRARRGRRRLLLFRLYQFVIAIAAVTAAIAMSFDYGSEWIALLAGGLVIVAVEGVAIATGITEWRRHAKLAAALSGEYERYTSGARGYANPEGRAPMLAERVDEILEETYRDWSDRSGLAPLPSRPDRGP